MPSRYLEILKDWNFWEKKIETGVLRKSYIEKLQWYADFEEVIAISGVRRAGKSTILRQLIVDLNKKKKVPFINTLHVNFEDPRFATEKLDAIDLFKIFEEYQKVLNPKGKIYVFLDEVQKVSRWEQFVRTLYDLHDRKNDLKFFVTGSNSTVFTSKLATSLTGRMINYSVSPLNFKEFLSFKKTKQNKQSFSSNKPSFSSNKQNLLDEYLRFGGFPQVVLKESEDEKRETLISYYHIILENDVIVRHEIKNKDNLEKLVLFLLSNVSNLISSYSLQKLLGFSNVDINRYIDYLGEAYLISRLPKFSYSVREQIYNPDKIYCIDTGLANTAGFNFSANRGRFLENLVFNQLKKEGEKIYYYKEKQEVDFAIFTDNKVQKLINVTLTVDDEEVLQRELNSLDEAGREFPKAEQILLTLYNQSGQKDPRIHSLIDFLLEK